MTPLLKRVQEEQRVRCLVEASAMLFRSWEDEGKAVTCALEIEAVVRRRIQLAKGQLDYA